ncbi:MAG: ComEA family DNA-binding protein, partial [Clostridia bacterium]
VVTAANASLPAGASVSTSSAKTSTVNLNTATADQLTTLPGIGKTRAEAIIAYREQHGRFTQVEQLTKITGIGSTVFERIKGQVSVE